ncbi:uncharacterized protein LOC111025209 [Momordica charantia]|uniref:Uncharacterized protein LOC111025209 n=1 Tax=Momordica charantia TaxID=3673 RepID=A0A6J1E0A9_MOMCH|nr:uncharacterized protein LOC111025209 [Momordica charantia]
MIPKIDPATYASAKLNCLSHIAKTSNDIKTKLTPKQLAMFRKTIFSHLLDVDLVFNGPLLGTKVSFGRREFDIISGLKYSRSPVRKITYPQRHGTLYFNNSTDLLLSELEKMYTSIRFEDDIDAVKVLVYFVELVLLGRERSTKFDHILLGIVDDWEACCNHDWALLSFDKTIYSLQRGASNKSKEGGLRKSYSLYGFPWAFQVWAYEIISSLSGHIVTIVSQDVVPRILQWRYEHSTAYHMLAREIFRSSTVS